MTTARQSLSSEDFRLQAHELARVGFAHLAHALNFYSAPDTPFRYSSETRDKLFRLGIEIARMFEHGAIEPNPEHDMYRRAIAAKEDATLQAVLRKASKRRRGRPPVFTGQST